ncbi:MAG: TetR/AcrR family transcriptional regulator C-terminal domain-containing protein [Pseudanabaena sp.]
MTKTTKSDSLIHVPLTRERILSAAMDLADKDGIELLSMRKLAQEMGVKAMSLYNHVTNKDDILDNIVDIVVSEIELPKIGGDWRDEMRRRAISAHEVLLRHPWAAMALMSRMNVGSAMLKYIDLTLGCLCEAGFSCEMADHAKNVIDSYIYGFTLQELTFPINESDYSEMAMQGLPIIPADKYPYLNKLAHQVIERSYDGIHNFGFGLELILNGLEPI